MLHVEAATLQSADSGVGPATAAWRDRLRENRSEGGPGTRTRGRVSPRGHAATPIAESSATPTRSHLHDGTRVPRGTSRRLSCDCAVVPVVHDPDDGAILDVGRRTRSIPPALRRALEVRDRGCRFPGCGLQFTDAHHVVHWVDGGETSLDNTLLLCRHHHRLVHEGGWTVGWWGEGRPVFHGPRGQTLCDGSWTMPDLSEIDGREDLGSGGGHPHLGGIMAGENDSPSGADGGAAPAPDGWTAAARWPRDADIPDELLFRVAEAL